jgi:hypothetical protein
MSTVVNTAPAGWVQDRAGIPWPPSTSSSALRGSWPTSAAGRPAKLALPRHAAPCPGELLEQGCTRWLAPDPVLQPRLVPLEPPAASTGPPRRPPCPLALCPHAPGTGDRCCAPSRSHVRCCRRLRRTVVRWTRPKPEMRRLRRHLPPAVVPQVSPQGHRRRPRPTSRTDHRRGLHREGTSIARSLWGTRPQTAARGRDPQRAQPRPGQNRRRQVLTPAPSRFSCLQRPARTFWTNSYIAAASGPTPEVAKRHVENQPNTLANPPPSPR